MEMVELKDFLTSGDSYSLAQRQALAEELCLRFNDQAFKLQELEVVHEILGILAHDIEASVRKSLAQNLKYNPRLPHKIALRLARDMEDTVSIPVLEYSSVLNEDDLIRIIDRTHNVSRLNAVARRDYVPPVVCDALVEKEVKAVAETLIANENAIIAEDTTQKIITHFHHSDDVIRKLIDRDGISMTVIEDMISHVSETMQREMVEKYNITTQTAAAVSQDIREDSLLDMLPGNFSESETLSLVEHLHQNKKLNHSVVLRALCRGNLHFFMAAMAKRAGVPVHNAEKLIMSGGEQGFTALYTSADMPANMLHATEIVLRFAVEEIEENDMVSFPRRMIERIAENGYAGNVPNLSYLITLIGNRITPHDTIH